MSDRTTYAGERRIIDVDSHIIERAEFLADAATPDERALLPDISDQDVLPFVTDGLQRGLELFEKRQGDPATMAKFEADVMKARANGWSRLGAFDPEERSHALDLMGFEEQWVLPTFSFHQIAHVDDHAVLEAGARALNRGLARFCAHDDRLRAVGYVPMSLGPERAGDVFDEGLEAGCFTFMVDTNEPDPEARSFTHPDFDAVWARFAAAARPFVVHVAVNGHYDAVSPSFNNNGRTDLSFGGDAPSTAVGFVTIKNSAELFLSALILDGVFDRHPELRGISMEHGAFWVPSWLRALDFTQESLKKIRTFDESPSETARTRLKVSPFAGEPVGWIMEQVGPEMLVFATDYTHPEGTSDPIGKFEATMQNCSDDQMRRFFRDNAAELLPSS